ncbi:MAG: ATP-dependent helicase [Aequorivita sp.]
MEAIDQIKEKITAKRSFVLEAGAGAGKTYALIQTINYLIETKSKVLSLNNQMIVCITYTNVAKNEIIDRLENNPLVLVSTIHEFLWDCIKLFNKQLIKEFDAINTLKHEEKPDKYTLGLIERIKSVEYSDRAFSDFEEGTVGHDDLIILSQRMFQNYELLTSILASKYPYVFVDEYQDTAPETIKALLDFLLPRNKEKIVLGFYGDSHQKIYDTGVGSLQDYVESGVIDIIKKEENYRSSRAVIDLLNNIRTNIKQKSPDEIEEVEGSVKFFNCANYPEQTKGQKITDYEKSLIPKKNDNYDYILETLLKSGWDFGPGSQDKILIIANSRVADRGGFGNLYGIFSKRYGQSANDMLLKRESHLISLFVGSMDKKTSTERKTGVEHLIAFYENKDYGQLSSLLSSNGVQSVNLKKHSDKEFIINKLEELKVLRIEKTVKDVYKFVVENKLVTKSKGLQGFIEKINTSLEGLDDDIKGKIERDISLFNTVMALSYSEVINFFKHTQNENVFSTKHGTKGEEYRNVLVVIDDTNWKQKYNFEHYFDKTEERPDRMERTKNLFYVSCSRTKENLVVLALSKMEKPAVNTISAWFGADHTIEIK